ncbi:MAG: hypothetical protein GXP05_10285 [Alphaproteobacteria bacterium]|nr:hypothetical protein [Alphaproteobacteria bacterium]
MSGFGKTLSGFSDADKAVMKTNFGLKTKCACDGEQEDKKNCHAGLPRRADTTQYS